MVVAGEHGDGRGEDGGANFDGIAHAYRWLEYLTLGHLLERTRTEFLPLLHDRQRALLLGDGDGRFLAALLDVNRSMSADAVDTSRTMLALLQRRAGGCMVGGHLRQSPRLRVHRQSALSYEPDFVPDLIVTHFFFDCLRQEEVNDLIQRLASHLAPGGMWLVSEFAIPSGWLRVLARLFVRMLYLAFRVLTGLRTTSLPDYRCGLLGAGFVRVALRVRFFGLLTSELWRKAV